ncbi:hypothetical protein VTO73DRAFT_4609 [Trametes versicolor]
MLPTLSLPVETVERAVSFLRGGAPSLAACSLTCHSLLPVSSIHLWHEVTWPVELDTHNRDSRSTRAEAFIRILNRNRNIAPYLRWVVVCPPPGYSYIDGIEFDGTTWAMLGAQLSAIRSLQLCDLLLLDLTGELVPNIRDRPPLEALVLNNVGTMLDNCSSLPASLVEPTARAAAVGEESLRWGLRKLSVLGNIITIKELSRLVLFLEQSAEVESLRVLDICRAMAPLDETPRGCVVFPGIPAFGESLRHFGITFRDTKPQARIAIDPEGRECFPDTLALFALLLDACRRQLMTISFHIGEHIQRVLLELPRCSSLRSLRLGYERTGAFMLGALLPSRAGVSSGYTPTPFFLELLADVLSKPGPAPLPLLESLTLVFGGPPAWLVGFEAAFARLAGVLTGTSGDAQGTAARRYPRFSRLDVRTTSLKALAPFFEDAEMAELRYRQAADRVHLALPMLAGFVGAGVHVEVTCV